MWQNFSSWLLFAGLVFGGLSILAGAGGLLLSRSVRAEGPSWVHAVTGLVVLVVAFINALVHAGDGWTAVVPNGLILSALTFVLMLLTAWLGYSTVTRARFGGVRHD